MQQTNNSTTRRVQTLKNHISMSSTVDLNETSSSVQSTKISLSSHVLETGRIGKPYNNMRVTLYRRASEHLPEIQLAEGVTNSNGRITNADWKWSNEQAQTLTNEIYRLRFHIMESGYDCMYPYADIHFTMKPDGHYHIPLTLNPFGYSTYKGS